MVLSVLDWNIILVHKMLKQSKGKKIVSPVSVTQQQMWQDLRQDELPKVKNDRKLNAEPLTFIKAYRLKPGR